MAILAGGERWLYRGRYPKELATQIASGCAGGSIAKAVTIARGHAFEKHVLGIGARADDPLFRGLGIRTVAQLERHVADVMATPTEMRALSKGLTAYWHEPSSTVVITNPRGADFGSVFQPKNSKAYFDKLQ